MANHDMNRYILATAATDLVQQFRDAFGSNNRAAATSLACYLLYDATYFHETFTSEEVNCSAGTRLKRWALSLFCGAYSRRDLYASDRVNSIVNELGLGVEDRARIQQAAEHLWMFLRQHGLSQDSDITHTFLRVLTAPPVAPPVDVHSPVQEEHPPQAEVAVVPGQPSAVSSFTDEAQEQADNPPVHEHQDRVVAVTENEPGGDGVSSFTDEFVKQVDV